MWPEDDQTAFAALSATAKLINEAMRHFAPAIVDSNDVARFAQWADGLALEPNIIASAFAELEAAKFAVKVGHGWQLASAARR